MHEKEIAEKKDYLAKADSTGLDVSISPEESKELYLKKIDGAGIAKEQLGDLELTDNDGQLIASSVEDKKKVAAIIEDKEEQVIIDKKLADAKAHDNEDGVIDFSVEQEDESMDDAVVRKKKEFAAQQEQESLHWWERNWQEIKSPFLNN